MLIIYIHILFLEHNEQRVKGTNEEIAQVRDLFHLLKYLFPQILYNYLMFSINDCLSDFKSVVDIIESLYQINFLFFL